MGTVSYGKTLQDHYGKNRENLENYERLFSEYLQKIEERLQPPFQIVKTFKHQHSFFRARISHDNMQIYSIKIIPCSTAALIEITHRHGELLLGVQHVSEIEKIIAEIFQQ